jgi:hypothetical protein
MTIREGKDYGTMVVTILTISVRIDALARNKRCRGRAGSAKGFDAEDAENKRGKVKNFYFASLLSCVLCVKLFMARK